MKRLLNMLWLFPLPSSDVEVSEPEAVNPYGLFGRRKDGRKASIKAAVWSGRP